MRSINFIIIFLLYLNNLQSQVASPSSFEVQSNNSLFKVKVSGNFYEGFVGPQKIQLLDYKNVVYWEKIFPRRGLHLPCVSNNGLVIVTKWSQLFLFNIEGDTLWEHELDHCNFLADEYDDVEMVQTFSDDNKLYFSFIRNYQRKETSIVCFSVPKKTEKWRLNLNNYRPCYLEFYKKYAIFHDFCISGVKYKNHCYVLDFDGNICWDFFYDLKSSREIKKFFINKQKNELHIELIDRTEKYLLK
jgi:hypothetical protein